MSEHNILLAAIRNSKKIPVIIFGLILRKFWIEAFYQILIRQSTNLVELK